MTLPVPRRLFGKPSRYSDNDEVARRKARAISKIGKAYQEGGAYDDTNPKPAEKVFDAAKDYDMLKRVRSLNNTRLPKKGR